VKSTSLPTRMRAVVLVGHGGLEKLVFRNDVTVPRPALGEVLVEVAACGINNTDLNTRTGWYAPTVREGMTEAIARQGVSSEQVRTWGGTPMRFPRIQGADGVGRIVAVGDDVTTARIGDRVIVDPCIRDATLPNRAQGVVYMGSERDGGYAEYMTAPSGNAHAVRCDVTDAELATFACSYSTAEEMLARARVTSGEMVLVTGASGGVGSALVQLATVRGAQVIAVAGPDKAEHVRRLGAAHVIPRNQSDLAEAVREISGSGGVDVVADVVGGAIFPELIRALRRAGRYVSAGAIAGPIAELDLRELVYRDLEMYGVANPEGATFTRLVRLIESGAITPILARTFPLEQLREAQEEFVAKRHVGKIVVVNNPSDQKPS
jgi:NADPH:quinone reductase-like Zn-dependent oxidoreductase